MSINCVHPECGNVYECKRVDRGPQYNAHVITWLNWLHNEWYGAGDFVYLNMS